MRTIKTRRIDLEDLRVLQRVQITGGRFDGELGTISGVAEGCSCRDGWTYVLLDNGHKDEFRHGYRGDASDLLLVTSEPNPPTFDFLEPRNAREGMGVKIWAGNQQLGEFANKGTGQIRKLDGSSALIIFSDGFQDWFYLGRNYATVMVSTDPIPTMPVFITPSEAVKGMAVKALRGDYSTLGTGELTDVITDDYWEETTATIRFADGVIGRLYIHGDRSVLVASNDPIPPKPNYVTLDNMRVEMAVEVLKGNRDYGHLAVNGVAELIEIDHHWAIIKFADGRREEMRIGQDESPLIHTDKPIPPPIMYVSRATATVDLPVRINPVFSEYYAEKGEGKITELDGNYVLVEFPAGGSDWFRLNDNQVIAI